MLVVSDFRFRWAKCTRGLIGDRRFALRIPFLSLDGVCVGGDYLVGFDGALTLYWEWLPQRKAGGKRAVFRCVTFN